MKKITTALLPVMLAGCATIFDGSSKTVTVGSNPDGAKFVIANRAGKTVQTGKTPQRVTLENGAGYFKSEKYTLTLTKPGYEDTTAILDTHIAGWYFGNLILGGALGMLIVDPLTGAMYQLPDDTIVPMRKLDGEVADATPRSQLAYSGTTAKSTLPENVRWLFQAEKLAAQMSCANTAFTSQGPGMELYETTCGNDKVVIRCDFGQCVVKR